MLKIRIGLVGYGNLGRGAEMAIAQNPDMELKGVFTRRNPESLQIETKGVGVYSVDDIGKFKGEVDVMILCGGSATDLPEQGPEVARMFHTIDSYDNHGKIPEYFEKMNAASKEGGNLGIISVGWDPGLFSINRIYAEAVLPEGSTYTFWGKGVSQGHSDAIRRVKGVKMGIQYTVPVEKALEEIRSGGHPELSAREKHLRECYVVPEEGADLKQIEKDIAAMPDYFADYNTTVSFITEEEFKKEHNKMPHGGLVMRNGKTGVNGSTNQLIEYSLKLESNPQFTSSVLVAYARAAFRLASEGGIGAKTVFDIAPSYLSVKSGEELRRELL